MIILLHAIPLFIFSYLIYKLYLEVDTVINDKELDDRYKSDMCVIFIGMFCLFCTGIFVVIMSLCIYGRYN